MLSSVLFSLFLNFLCLILHDEFKFIMFGFLTPKRAGFDSLQKSPPSPPPPPPLPWVPRTADRQDAVNGM